MGLRASRAWPEGNAQTARDNDARATANFDYRTQPGIIALALLPAVDPTMLPRNGASTVSTAFSCVRLSTSKTV
jgi:hypothetical protein